MKKVVSICIALVFTMICNSYGKPAYDSPIPWNRTQTFLSSVTPQEVVVVYNTALAISDSVKNYYIEKRNIPSSNVIGIDLPDNTSAYGATYDSQTGQISGLAINKSIWKFYETYIETPIMNEMDSRTVDGVKLRDKARFIVVVRGIPQTLNATGSYSDQYHYNASVDALLCLLFQDFMDLYGTHYRTQFNAYYATDMNYTFDYRFKSNHFSNGRFHLSYLVSRLDGGVYPNNFETIKQAIDNGCSPDKSGSHLFVLDDKDSYNRYLDLKGANLYLTSKNFRTEFNTNSQHITTHAENIMGYSSHGVHAGLPQDYVINQLNFSYAKGAVFNTAESFNGWTFNQREAKNQGLLADFIGMGGTGGIANVQEPYSGSIARTSIFFTAYAMGYSLVEAAYMSIPYLGWVQTVIGDPFTTIAQAKDGITQDTFWKQDLMVTGDVYLTQGNTLTVSSGNTITFMGSSKLYVQPGANLILEEGAILKTLIENPSQNEPVNFVTGTQNELGEINFSQIDQSSEVAIQSIANSLPSNVQTEKVLHRYYNIEVEDNNFQAKVVLPYDESDIKSDAIKEKNLTLMFNGGSNWVEIGGELDTLNNTITYDGVTNAGVWAIYDPSQDYILPVSLLSFNAAKVQHGVKLNWSTSSETDNEGFIVLRDGKELAHYNYNHQLKGNGTATSQNDYTFTDYNAYEGNTYEYRIRSVDYSGEIHDYEFSVTINLNDISEKETQKNVYSYKLNQNYPNPFNPTTQIPFSLDKVSHVRLDVYDLLGRLVKTLVNEEVQPGNHTINFDARHLSSGTYIYRLHSLNRVKTQKMVLIK